MMHRRKVVQYTRDMQEIRRYDSIKEAQAEYNITHISGVCRRHRKTDGEGRILKKPDACDRRPSHMLTIEEPYSFC